MTVRLVKAVDDLEENPKALTTISHHALQIGELAGPLPQR
jgi:hypothetical protein